MFGKHKPKSVPEEKADGDIERVYHEIKQTLRVSGVNLNFQTWAGEHPVLLPILWAAALPSVETRAFENAADDVRREAAGAAAARPGFVRAPDTARPRLGESQQYQIRAALDLYHYVNPKLLLITSAVRLALEGETIGGQADLVPVERVERGAPPEMAAMEMVSETPDDKRLQDLFEDIKETLSLRSVNSDYRTLALWPDYLADAWRRLKPITGRDEYTAAADRLRETARTLVRTGAFPFPFPLSRERVRDAGDDPDKVLKTTEMFEQLLPPLILNVALLQRDWRQPGEMAQSPFPAKPRREGGSTR